MAKKRSKSSWKLILTALAVIALVALSLSLTVNLTVPADYEGNVAAAFMGVN